jgi:hypothetical protein
MPNPIITTQFAMPDPNASPLNLTQLFQLANVLVSSEMLGNFQSYVLQSGTPNVEDQDKVWFQKDAQGRPVAIKVYWNGSWRRVYNGMLNEIRGYTGNPGTDFESTGWGVVGGEYDGWHLCNGNDGAPDFSDHFLIAAHMNNEDHSGYVDGEWVAWINDDTGLHTGGEKEFTMSEDTTWLPSGNIGTLTVGTYQIAGATLFPGETKWGQPSASDDTKNTDLNIQSEGSLEPDAIPIIPPFIALAWIIFLGYRL